jgi:hypothetical protein
MMAVLMTFAGCMAWAFGRKEALWLSSALRNIDYPAFMESIRAYDYSRDHAFFVRSSTMGIDCMLHVGIVSK